MRSYQNPHALENATPTWGDYPPVGKPAELTHTVAINERQQTPHRPAAAGHRIPVGGATSLLLKSNHHSSGTQRRYTNFQTKVSQKFDRYHATPRCAE